MKIIWNSNFNLQNKFLLHHGDGRFFIHNLWLICSTVAEMSSWATRNELYGPQTLKCLQFDTSWTKFVDAQLKEYTAFEIV